LTVLNKADDNVGDRMLETGIGPCAGTGISRTRARERRTPVMELVIGLVIMFVIWAVVIYGSEYLNKNIQ
jgi:hypothetical protein